MAEVVELLTREDIIQQYLNNIVFYKGEPVNVIHVDAGAKTVDIRVLETTEVKNVPFNLNDFKAPISRLGMLNYEGNAFYLTRIPVRRMNIGLDYNNLVFATLPIPYTRDPSYLIDNLRELNATEFVKMFKGDYPKLDVAIKEAKSTKGACAFDRQFAVDNKGQVFYKTKKVGSVKDNSEIVWDTEYLYLSILLENNHEKTVGISCSKTC